VPRTKKATKDETAARKAGLTKHLSQNRRSPAGRPEDDEAANGSGAGSKKSVTDAASKTIAVDRRNSNDRRGSSERRKASVPVAVERRKLERRQKVSRRRQIDPTTCERDYSDDEVEFMNALDEYKRKSGRMFPTCSEVLEVIRDLGYGKLTKPAALQSPKSTPRRSRYRPKRLHGPDRILQHGGGLARTWRPALFNKAHRRPGVPSRTSGRSA